MSEERKFAILPLGLAERVRDAPRVFAQEAR